jgi:hypothetical protein
MNRAKAGRRLATVRFAVTVLGQIGEKAPRNHHFARREVLDDLVDVAGALDDVPTAIPGKGFLSCWVDPLDVTQESDAIVNGR